MSSTRTTWIPAEVERLDQRQQFGVHEEEARAGVAEDVVDLGRAEAGVDGDEDAAGGGDGEVGLQHRRGVGAEEGDAVVLLETDVAQAVGEAIDALGGLALGVAAVTMDDGGVVRENVGGATEEGDGGEFGAVRLVHRLQSSVRSCVRAFVRSCDGS